MPIYEYHCNSCGKNFELIQKFSDKPVKKCIHCAVGKVEKIISQSSFHLKGSGWHATDYASTKKEKTEPAASAPARPQCAGCPSAKGK